MGVQPIIFNGFEIWHPGSYSKYDIAKLNQGAPASRSLVYLGEAETGIPFNAADFKEAERINVVTSGSHAKTVLSGGKLYDCARFALAPSPAEIGPANVICLVVNQITRATKILKATAVDTIDIKSYIYGKPANDIRIAVADGSTQGKMLKVAKNDEYNIIIDNIMRGVLNITYTGVEVAATVAITSTNLTITAGVDSVDLTLADYKNLGALANYLNSLGVFEATMIQDAEFDHTYLDEVTGIDIKNPAAAVFYDNLKALIDIMNRTGHLVANISTGASRVMVDNTTGYVFLSGAVNVTATQQNWADAHDFARKIKCAYIGVATGAPAVHALLSAHVNYMRSTVGRDERQACVGELLETTDADKKTSAFNMANQAVGYWTDPVWQYDDAGFLKEYDPLYGAAMLLGISAGNTTLFSPTFKQIATAKLTKLYTSQEADEFISKGCIIMEPDPQGGFRVVRAVTTFAGSNKIANDWQATGHSFHVTKSHRREMEIFIGRVGVSESDIGSYSVSVLEDYESENLKWLQFDPAYENAFRDHKLIVEGDTFKIEYEGTIPVTTNFVLTTHHFTVIGAVK